jgi:IS5 family transposase
VEEDAKREVILEEMELVVPWKALIKLIWPHYPWLAAAAGRTRWGRCCGGHLMQNSLFKLSLGSPLVKRAFFQLGTSDQRNLLSCTVLTSPSSELT